MEDKHDISTYSKLAEAANFYLNESFHYINSALETELSGIIFSEKIQNIDATAQDRQIIKNVKIPTNTISLLQSEIDEVLTTETYNKLSLAWQQAQLEAQTTNYNFQKSYSITSIELLGHLNNFAFFIETLANRHLLFLKHTAKLSNFVYNQLSLAKILNRLIVICKDELDKNTIQLNEVASLFAHRNKTVHYTPDNAISLQIDIAALIRIWKQTVKLINLFETKEKFNENQFSQLIDEHIKHFESKWTK